MPYLLKSEPDTYSFEDLLREGQTTWDGIRNPQALITLRNMRKGERCVIYHSNVGKAAVGTATVVKVDAADPKNPLVTLKAGKAIKQPKPLAAIREEPLFHGSLLFRQFRLSVVPLSEEQYDWLVHGTIQQATGTPQLRQSPLREQPQPKHPARRQPALKERKHDRPERQNGRDLRPGEQAFHRVGDRAKAE